jgi:D-lyxose ketol-isomerase
MKRSEINRIMRDAIAFLEERQFYLPPFAFWTPGDWRSRGTEAAEIVETQMGWDITDFGGGDFCRLGLFMFTLRNGRLENLETMEGKLYAEKILIVREQQVTPFHFHFQKMEDIINRGGGELLLQFYNPAEGGNALADTDVTVTMDGVTRTLAAGETVCLRPGESVTLPTWLYHKFWGAPGKGTVLVGEVSRINDDMQDNRFLEKRGRFPEIVEDEEPLYLLVGDYDKYYSAAA